MHLKDMDVFWVHFLLGLTAVQCEWSVTHSSRRVCGLKGASVVLPCTYQYLHGDTYQRGEWYEEKSMRVIKHSNSNYPDCSLTIDKLSENHAGVYKFRFYTVLHHMAWITDKPGVVLSITDLQVKEAPVGNQTKVTCSTSCSLGSQYVWYKNGQTLQGETTASILLDSTRPSEKGNYSCAVRGYVAHRSPARCAPREQCWGVTYSSNRFCALKGSSVDIPCTYRYPRDHRIKAKYWFNKQKSSNHPKDLLSDKEYRTHALYPVKKDNDCTLRLNNIRVDHSGEYAFRFTTGQREDYTGLPGVNIIVTALQVLVTSAAVTEGERVTLTCSTTCTLSDNTTFTWFKNSLIYKNTTDENLQFDPVQGHDSGNYSCAVRGQDSLASTEVLLNVRYVEREEDAAWPVKAGIITIMVAVILLALGIVSFRKWSAKLTANTLRALENTQSDLYSSVSVCPLASDVTQRVDSQDLGDVQYASVHFSRTRRQEASARRSEQDCVVYSNVRDLSQS